MKAVKARFIALAILLLALCACSRGAAEPAATTSVTEATTMQTTETTQTAETAQTEWTLRAGSTALSFRADGGELLVTSLSGEASNWGSAPFAMAMPQRVSAGENGLSSLTWALKSAEAGESSLCFTFSCAEYPLERSFLFEACAGGVITVSGECRNLSEQSVKLWPDEMFGLNITPPSVPELTRVKKESGQAEGLIGGNFKGSGIYVQPLSDGAFIPTNFSVHNDWNANGYIPMVYLDCGAEGLFFAVEWPHGRILATNKDGVSRVCADFESGFATAVPAGESFAVPTVYFGLYSGDTDDGANLFKRWFFENKAPDKLSSDETEPYTQLDDQGMALHSDLASWGVQSLKWDYGWWTDNPPVKQGWMRDLEGDWQLRNSAYIGLINAYGCQTVGEYGTWLAEHGYNFTVYFTLHDSESETPGALTSVGPNGHPEWFSNRVITVGASADLGNPDCVEFIKATLLERMNEFNCQTWRSDFEPICFSSDKENRHYADGRDVSYWCAVGFYDLVDYLYEAKPDFRYECCGSGGSLKDYATLSRAIVINTDDSADYTSLRTTFYDSSYCICPAQLMLPCNPDTFCSESSYYTGTADKDFGMRSIMLGVPMFGSWTGPGTTGHWPFGLEEYLREYYTMYCEKIKPLVRHADLYHILPRPDGVNWDGVEYYNPDSGDGAAFIFKPTDAEGSVKEVRFRGLEPDASYAIVFEDRPEQNAVLTGAELLAGIELTISGDMGSEIIWITRR